MIVFDLDDTLYLERDFALSGYAALEGYIKETTGQSGFRKHCENAFMAGRYRNVFDEALAALGLTLDAKMLADLIERYRSHSPEISLCSDAKRCLERLKSTVSLGLITDGPEKMQRNKIEALNVASFFTVIRPTGAWGAEFSKPHPRAYMEMEGAAARDAPMVYVADNALKDFVTPRKRGWLTVQICREGRVHTAPPPDPSYAPHARIETLDALEATLKKLGWPHAPAV